MKVAAALAAVSLALPMVSAHPLDSHNLHKKMAGLEERYSNIVVTTGVPGATYPRLEIRQMAAQQPNQFTLLLLAMQQWQAQSESSATSYYGVSTIHGVPLVNYNNVGQCSNCNGAYGYCTHNMVLFPAWHRAYTALFEQEFMQVVNSVAAQFTGSQASVMKAAAATMRFPYWDWAAIPQSGQPVIPTSITNKYVTVNGPKGSQSIVNPLFRSSFDNPSNMVYADFVNYKVTYRYPNAPDGTAASQENKVIAAFAQQHYNLRQSVYQLMTACTDYLSFSNTGSPSSGGCTTSLEGIHNIVHQTAGGGPSGNILGGHMYYLPTASFDPVFWLHHANIDRLFAFWQTMHPNSYGASQTAQGNTWTIAQGTALDANSPLTPFYKDNSGNFWTTNEVKNWASTFHYTYPEFSNSDGSKAAIASYVNKLYGPSATAQNFAAKPTRDVVSSVLSSSSAASSATVASSATTAAPKVSSSAASVHTSSFGTSTAIRTSAAAVATSASAASSQASGSSNLITDAEGMIGAAAGVVGSIISTATSDVGAVLQDSVNLVNGSTYNYYANVKAPTNAMNGSYVIYVFHGLPTQEDPSTWPFDQNMLGSVPMLVNPGMAMGDGLRAAGSVPLTQTLDNVVTSGVIGGLAEPLVVPYLQSNLHWRVVGTQGQSVDPSTIKGLMVSVSSTKSSAISSIYELPVVSDFKLLPAVTANKPGGLQHVDSWAANTVSGVLSSLLNAPSTGGQAAACPASY